jgi:outer membrane protein assembly factor BamB
VYHDDPAGTGVAAGVGSVDTAARAWTSPTLDGQLYGEPLVFGDRVYVATENDVVYALSAATGAISWSTRLGTPVRSGMVPCGDITPTVGITGTPVIDEARGEIFVVAAELKNGKPAHILTGLNTGSGRVELSQDVDPPGQVPVYNLQRTGLTLDDGACTSASAGTRATAGSTGAGSCRSRSQAGHRASSPSMRHAASTRERSGWAAGHPPSARTVTCG